MLKAETMKGRMIPMLSDGVVRDDRLIPLFSGWLACKSAFW